MIPTIRRLAATTSLIVLAACGGSSSPDTSADVVPEPKQALEVSAQRRHTCVLTTNGEVECWGLNAFGRLGDGTTVNRSAPSKVVFPDGIRITALSKGIAAHTCGIDEDAALWCWGLNTHGQLGTFDLSRTEVAVRTRGLDQPVTAAVTTEHSTCVLTADGDVSCWGDNTNAVLGQQTDRLVGVNLPGSVIPIVVPGIDNVTNLYAGGNHLCALQRDGALLCWGDNKYGQLGIGLEEQTVEPRPVVGLTARVRDVALGQSHSCVLLDGGSVTCWGANQHDQLGFQQELVPGEVPFASKPTQNVALPGTAVAVSAGRYFSCATLADGTVWCWGKVRSEEDDPYAVVTDDDRSLPSKVEGVSGASGVDGGSRHLCWIVADAGVRCAGKDDDGQIGNGPADVSELAAVAVVGYGG